MAGHSVLLSLSLIHNPRSLLQYILALLSSALDCETVPAGLKTRYSANSQSNSQTSNEGRARENDPEPVVTICVALCVALCVVFCVALCVELCVGLCVGLCAVFSVALPVLLFIVSMFVSVAAAADVLMAEVLAMTDAGHVGPNPKVEQRSSSPCEVNDDA